MSMTCKWVYKGHEFNSEIELDDMERKTLETEREDLLYYLE